VTFGAASYTWQFGDGTTAQTTVPLAYHRYLKGGVFSVTLTVADGDGTQSSSTLQLPVFALPAGERLPSIAGPSLRSRRDPGYARVATREAGSSRTVLCWNKTDWPIFQKAFDDGIGGYVDPAKPRQIGLAPAVCSALDSVRYRKPAAAPTTKEAVAILVLGREIEQSRGYVNTAQTTCYGLQLVPETSLLLGASATQADRLGTLAAKWYKRSNLPFGSWSGQCRDGGKLDLDPRNKHWP